METKMKLLGKVSFVILLVFTILACSVFSPNGETSPSGQVIDSDMLIINTNNPNYGIVLSNQNGEALLLATETRNDGTVTNVKSATWISPEKDSITVYFDNGLPTYAVAYGNIVIFEYNLDNTVNVKIIAPDGTQSNQPNVPIDLQKIPKTQTTSMPDGGSSHLAMITMQPDEMTSKEWGRFASIAFGVFSCTATIASGGTLSILFGVGCAATIYTIWATSQGEESPVLESSATGVLVGQCAIGIAEKNPISAADCASAVIDIGSKFTEASNDVVLHNQAVIPTKELSSQSESTTPNADPECAQLKLTPEECANFGIHEYSFITKTSNKECSNATNEGKVSVNITITSNGFNGIYTYEKGAVIEESWTKIEPNSYSTSSSYYNDADDYGDASITINMNSDGFSTISEYTYNSGTHNCTWYGEYTLIK
jgi:hypothetical protein